jgi:hypothetical protein
MIRVRYRVSLSVVVAVLIAAGLAIPVFAAAPRIMIIYGGTLTQPIILVDWQENLQLMSSVSDVAQVTPADLAQRPYFQVAMFWGPDWVQYIDDGHDPTTLRPDQATQHGLLYPGYGAAPPIFQFDSIPGPGPLTRQITSQGIDILSHHGVPVQVAPATSDTIVFRDIRIWAIAGLVVLVVAAAMVIHARRQARPS